MSFFRSLFSARRVFSLLGDRRPNPRNATRPRPRLEQLEDRVTPSTNVTFVDDNWVDLSRTSGGPQVGDIIQNLDDTINPGSVTAAYGITGFGTVLVGNTPGTVPGAATISDAIANTNAGGTVNVLEGTYSISGLAINQAVTLRGPNATISPNTGTRVAEAVINGGGSADIRVGATDPVTFIGLTFTGDVLDSYTTGNQVTFSHDVIANLPGNMFYANSASFTLTDNHIYGTADNWDDVLIAGDWNGTTGTQVSITNNVIENTSTSSTSSGLNLGNVAGTVSGNTFQNKAFYAVLLANNTNVSVTGNTFNDIYDPDPATYPSEGAVRFYTPGPSVNDSIASNLFENSYAGVAVRQGSNTVGLTINIAANTFTHNTYDIVNLGNGGLNPAGDNVFDGVTLSSATTAQLYAIEDKVVDAIDVSGVGLVRLKAGNVYVTPNSFFAPSGTTTPSIQRGVDAASAGDTVNVEAGTYTNSTAGSDSVVNIDKPLIVQATDGAANTIIDGHSATDDYYVVKITASNVTLSGFTITNPLYSGTADASGVLVESLTNNAPLTGVNVTGNIIHDVGLLNRASAFATLGVNFEGVNSGSGVVDSIIQNNTIYNIGNADPTSFAVGVLTAGDVGMEVNNVTISGNTIYNVSNPSLAAGVDVGFGSENIAVNGNTIGLNGASAGPVGVGIRTGSGVFGPVTISNNTVENASVAGEQLDSPFSQSVTGDNLQHDAVGVDAQNGTVSLQNLTLSNDGTGFTASNLTALTLADLTLTNNSTAGGTISNVPTVNDTPSSGSAGVVTTIGVGSIQSGANQAITFTSVTALNVTGGSGADTFNVTPNATTTITVHGGLPTPPASPGDTLAVNLAGTTNPKRTETFNSSTGYSGSWTFGNRASIHFDGIETVSPSGPEVAVLKTNGELDLVTASGAVQVLSPAGTIQSISSTFDASFNNDIFAIVETPGYVGTLWEHSDAFGWKEISSGSFQQISATTNAAGQAVVFGVLTDGSLWEQNPAGVGLDMGWTELSPAGTIQSVSAVTASTGDAVAFAVVQTPGYTGTLWEHSEASGWKEISSGSFQQVSGGRNASGQAIVFGVLTDGSLWEQNPAGAGLDVGWTQRSGAGTVVSVTAGGAADEAFVIETDHHLYRLTPSGLTSLSSTRSVASVSATETAAGQDEVFATMTDSSLWEYSPTFPGDHFQQLIASGVESSSIAPRVVG